MKEPGLDGRHRHPRDGIVTKEPILDISHRDGITIGSKPKVSRERLAQAFDSASRSTGAFTSKRAK